MNQSVISTRNTGRAVEFLRIPGAPVNSLFGLVVVLMLPFGTSITVPRCDMCSNVMGDVRVVCEGMFWQLY